MDEQQQRLLEDLSGALDGEIACDFATLSVYSSDASLCSIRPLAVAFPRNQADVLAIAQYSNEQSIPVIPRGAGTGLAGGALGTGIIVDFSRYMNQILEIGEQHVVVQPGIVLDQLNQKLAETGRYFPPDPANAAVTTIGGMIGVDAAGSHAVQVGSTRNYVDRLQLVLAGGVTLDAMKKTSVPETPDHEQSDEDSVVRNLLGQTEVVHTEQRRVIRRLINVIEENQELIALHQPYLPRNCAGYYMRGLLDGETIDLPKLLVGSEGTLGMVTEARLHTLAIPEFRGVVLFEFGEMPDALNAIKTIVEQQPSACDLLDRRISTLVRESNPRYAKLISPHAEAVMIVEQTGNNDRQMKQRLSEIVRAVRLTNPTSHVTFTSDAAEDVEFVWGIARNVTSLLNRLKGATVPLPFVEDIAIPPNRIPDFLPKAQRVFQRHEVTASLYAHAASGQLHLRPFMPDYTADGGEKLQAVARDLYRVVFDYGGTMSGEHGDGLTRTSFLRSQYGPLYRVFKSVKDIFDPKNLMNPEKIISNDPHLLRRHLRLETQPSETIELQLSWNHAKVKSVIGDCNRCGTCRVQGSSQRMCPFFHNDQFESASPRAKSNLMADIMAGRFDAEEVGSSEVNAVASLCFNCKQCESECPTQVDIPHLFNEMKAQYVAANGVPWAEWLLSRAHLIGNSGTRFSLLVNPLLTNRLSRWLMEKLFGISRHRKLPAFASHSFVRFAERLQKRDKRIDPGKDDVIYFVDQFANFHDPQIGRSVLAINRKLDQQIFVPVNQGISGMSYITNGEMEKAREVVDKNIRDFVEYARDGHDIISTEPSAHLCLKREYEFVVSSPETQVVSKQSIDFGEYLSNKLNAGTSFDFRPVPLKIGYHVPCHVKAVYGQSPYIEILKNIPELEIIPLNDSCTGMAGLFGLIGKNHEKSQQIGSPLFDSIKESPIHLACTECSSCKMQMEYGSGMTTIHPVKLIAYAMGTPVKSLSELRGFPQLK